MFTPLCLKPEGWPSPIQQGPGTSARNISSRTRSSGRKRTPLLLGPVDFEKPMFFNPAVSGQKPVDFKKGSLGRRRPTPVAAAGSFGSAPRRGRASQRLSFAFGSCARQTPHGSPLKRAPKAAAEPKQKGVCCAISRCLHTSTRHDLV